VTTRPAHRRGHGVISDQATVDTHGTAPGRHLPARPTTTPEFLPLWFERGLVVVTAAIVSCGGFGLLLAFVGHYRILPVLLVGGVVTIALSAVAWPDRRRGHVSARTAVPAAIGMIVVAIGSMAWNAAYSGHHVAVGRDPGVYADAGKWIAVHGNLEVRTGPDWASKGPKLSVLSAGMYVEGGDRLEFQFDHLTPVLLAEGDNIGGDRLMFRVPAVLGALGLCAIYAVGCRLLRRPWLALAAVTALAVSLPQLNVSRDTYSEPAVQLLVWAGIWLLVAAYERRRLGMALLAGAALAATMLSRIDAPVYLIPLPLLAALVWVSTRPGQDRRFLVRMYAAVVAAAVPVAILGTVDVADRAGHYYIDLSSQVRQLKLGLAGSALAGVVVVALWPLIAPRTGGVSRWLGSQRSAAGAACGSLAGLGLLAAWLVRPSVMHPRQISTPAVYGFMGALQQAAGYALDPSRTYAEKSVVWITWYLGPITVGLAVIGVAVLVMRVVRRPDPTTVLVWTVAGAGTALYLWSPSINPDQIWAMRRFVPVGLPLFVLLAAAALAQLAAARFAARSASIGARLIVAAGVIGLVALPLRTTLPVRDFKPQAGNLLVLDTTCRVTGVRAAILVVPGNQFDQELPAALRSWCDVPVARLTGPLSAAQLQQIARGWQAAGRSLWVIGASPAFIAASAPGLLPTLVAGTVGDRELEVRLAGPPRSYSPADTLSVYAAPVSP
jgi:hypothetical protein